MKPGMQEANYYKTFSYTAHRGALKTALGTLGMLMGVEGIALVLLIVFLAPGLLLKVSLVGGFIAIQFAIIYGLLLSTTRTRHWLTATHLHLHFGNGLNVAIPRSAIAEARAVRENMTMFGVLAANYDQMKQRIIAAFSDQGQIELRLSTPLDLKIGRSSKPVKSILFNVDQRDELLAELRLSEATEKQQEKRMDTRERVLTQRRLSSAGVKLHEKTTPAIQITGLTRRFDSFVAVDNLNMTIEPGEIYGFLGSNGAGKTTTIKMLVGLLQPDAGQATIAGYDIWNEPVAAKTKIGYVADRAILYERLTGRDFLSFLAQMRGLPRLEAEQRIEKLLTLLDLSEHAQKLCGSYSFGMKRKLALAGALLHKPDVLILDEPLNGLDPRSARHLKDLFIDLAAAGSTILLSTHDLATAEEICNRVGIIHRGRLLAEGNADELRALAQAPDLEAVFLNLTADVKAEEEVAL